MKKRFNIVALSLATLFITSCETDLTRINENPNENELASVSPQFLLTTVSRNIFQVRKGPLFVNRMMIAIDGENTEQYMKWDSGSFGDYSYNLLN
ncbi:MAG: SusD/RagB family nutrient-binding outer membrane lipoprotein, partial [Bergeyella zoohelcum]|nr:SusD/RagB family nutrient-binding outer membrane lipoprotein [Bergeyella zoohelcum]